MQSPRFTSSVAALAPATLTDSSSTPSNSDIRPLVEIVPTSGLPFKVADGIWWMRLPLSGLQDHVNVYLHDDKSGWILVDTGSNTPACREAAEGLQYLEEFSGRSITHVIATHYHPDHIGLAGWLGEQGATLVTTRTCWLSAKMLQTENQTVPVHEQIQFLQRAGLPEIELQAYRRRSPSNYSNMVTPLPYSYRRIQAGSTLKIGNRMWTVHIGNGHASEHATLWSNDGIAIVGDQILPSISPNLSIHPSEPEADLADEWLESCERLAKLATDETLCLPGHGFPFFGIKKRCDQLISNIHILSDRLLECLARPRTAIECLTPVYRRPLSGNERETLIAEVVGLLNHQYRLGLVRRELVGQAYIWSKNNEK